MALGTVTLVTNAGGRPTAPLYVLDMTMVGDAAYATGGSSGFAAAVQAAAKAATPALNLVVTKANIMGIVPIDLAGYHVNYDKTNDKVIVYYGNNDGGADGPAVEVAAAADLSSVTFRFSVLLQ
jgi:hypothetical protein